MRLAGGARVIFRAADEHGDLLVRKALLLGAAQKIGGDGRNARVRLELGARVGNVLELVQEPLVNLGELPDAVDRVALVEHRLADGKQALVGGARKRSVKVVKRLGLEAGERRVDHADGLLERLLKGAADGHHLADALHRRANVAADVLELFQVPARDLAHDIVEARLEKGLGLLGDGVGKLGQRKAERELGSNKGEGVAGRLGGERAAARKTRVHLDHDVLHAVGVERVLHIALTDNADVAHDLDGGRAEHVVLGVGERLRRRNDDRVARVDAERVKVFHVANRNAVVVGVAHDLVLDLLPALHRALDQDLRRKRERPRGKLLKLVGVVRKARAKAAKRKGRAHNHGVADLLRGGERGGHGRHGRRARERNVDLGEGGVKELAVLAHDERLDGRAQHAHAVALQNAGLVQLDAAVERGLAAKGEQDAVGALALNHIRHILGRHRHKVDAVGEIAARLDRGNVGVYEDRLDALLLEGLDRLRARIVKLARLADREAARSEHEHALGRHRRRALHLTRHVGAGCRKRAHVEKRGAHGTRPHVRVIARRPHMRHARCGTRRGHTDARRCRRRAEARTRSHDAQHWSGAGKKTAQENWDPPAPPPDIACIAHGLVDRFRM